MKEHVVMDIFCGAGGMSEGFIQAGFHIAFASDINKDAMDTYTNRHKQLGYKCTFACEDIRIVSTEGFLKDFIKDTKVDVVCGGPPCQGYSLAGKRDKNDPRNVLFKSYIETIKNVKPSYFVMENVEGILSMRFDEFHGPSGIRYIDATVPEILISEFYEIDYNVEFSILQANDYGVPQTRRRVFFLGHKIKKINETEYEDLVTPPLFPTRSVDKDVTIEEAIDDLSFLESGHSSRRYSKRRNLSEYQIQSINGRTPSANGVPIKAEVLHNHEAARHSQKVIERFSLMRPGESLSGLRERLGEERWREYQTSKSRCEKVLSYEPSPTVLTLPDDLVHYSKNRIMTVREFARIQSFDDSFVFLGNRTTGGPNRKLEVPQYTQVANAVPPLMAKAVATEIMKACQKSIRGTDNK